MLLERLLAKSENACSKTGREVLAQFYSILVPQTAKIVTQLAGAVTGTTVLRMDPVASTVMVLNAVAAMRPLPRLLRKTRPLTRLNNNRLQVSVRRIFPSPRTWWAVSSVVVEQRLPKSVGSLGQRSLLQKRHMMRQANACSPSLALQRQTKRHFSCFTTSWRARRRGGSVGKPSMLTIRLEGDISHCLPLL